MTLITCAQFWIVLAVRLLGCLVLCYLAPCGGPLANAADRAGAAGRPNVVLILSDDQGTLDLGCYGSKDLETPHLDALAARGVRFTQVYTASPVCSPSRAALLTGRYPQRARVTGNAPSRPGETGMPGDQFTLAELLKEAGYRTALFGKWHLGTVGPCEPLAQGFDEFFGHKSGCIDNYSHFFYWQGPPWHDLWHNDHEVWRDGEYFGNLIVHEATRFIETHAKESFFLYLPINLPHYPLQPQARFREHYQELAEPRRSYAAVVSTLDAMVGEVLAKIDELGLRDNTLVIFLSDHGHSTEERANFGGGNSGPYRGQKFSLFEGGIRVPCIASLPGRIPTGQVRDQPAISTDWFATVAELCQIKLPRRKFDGESLVRVLEAADAPAPHEVLHWQLNDQWAVRQGEWKLVANGVDATEKPTSRREPLFLANLIEDESETTTKSLAARHPEIVKRFEQLHADWTQNVAAQ